MPRALLPMVVCCLCSCILFNGTRDDSLTLTRIATDSLQEVYGELRLASSLPLDSENLLLDWEPAAPSCWYDLTPAGDTLVIHLLEDLSHATPYRLVITDDSRVREGDPLRDTLWFTTIDGEAEPNNGPATADTLRIEQVLAGSIDPRFDADWFWLCPNFSDDSALVVLSHLTADLDLDWLDTADQSTLDSARNFGAMPDTVRVCRSPGPVLLRVAGKAGSGNCGRYRLRAVAF